MSDEPIRRKARWQAFYEEPDGLKDMFTQIRREMVDKILKADPGDAVSVVNLKIAANVSEHLEQMILSIIAKGTVAEAVQNQARKIEAIPDHKRRWATGA